jgi:hypothetical protein
LERHVLGEFKTVQGSIVDLTAASGQLRREMDDTAENTAGLVHRAAEGLETRLDSALLGVEGRINGLMRINAD